MCTSAVCNKLYTKTGVIQLRGVVTLVLHVVKLVLHLVTLKCRAVLCQ